MKELRNVWIMKGQEERLANIESLHKDLLDYSFMYCTLSYEMKQAIYKKHNIEMPEQSCKVGKYVITDKGMMFQLHGKLFKVLSNPDDISDTPYEADVEILREARSFDF